MVYTFFYIQVIIIAILASIACTVPGVLLVIRGISLMSDAISHAVLLGIVLAFFYVRTIHSPLVFFGAVFAACATIFLTEKVIRSKLLKQDAAVGLIFPLFFSIAVILISRYARFIHLDVDMILTGEILLAPLQQYTFFTYPIGAQALWNLMGIIILNSAIVFFFFREFQLTIFDPVNAQINGYFPVLYQYLLMVMTSMTTVFVFDIVGTVLCVALIIVPAATAFLHAQSLKNMFFYAAYYAVFNAIVGTIIGFFCDISIAGTIASAAGICFFVVVVMTNYSRKYK